MAATLGDAYVNIIPSTEGISGKLTEALSAPAEKAGEEAGNKAGNKMTGTIAKLIGGGAAALVGSTAAMAGAMVAGAKGVAEYGDSIDKMSQKIGISAEEYQKWDYVLARAGTSVDVMKTGMKTLSAQAMNNSEAFQQLGISTEEAASMSNADLFQAAVEKLSSMEEGAERTTLATQLLGKAGLEMGPLFNGGTDAIREQMAMAEEYGMVMSDDMVAASAVFQDSMETLGRTMGGVKNTLLAELLPSMSEVADGMSLILSGSTTEGVEKMSQGIQDLVGKIAAAVPDVLRVGGELIVTLAKAIIKNAPTMLKSTTEMMGQMLKEIANHLPQLLSSGVELIKSLAQGILNNAPAALSSATGVMTQVLSNILSNLPKMMENGAQLLGKLAEGLANNAPKAITAIAGVIAKVLAEIAKNLPAILQKGIELIGQLAAGLIKAIPQAVAAIPQVISGIKEKFSSFDWGELGLNIIKGIATGISNAGHYIMDAALGAAKGAFDTVKSFFGISSPSKLMRDQIGRFIPAGIAEGILSNEGVITDAMKDITDLTSGSISADLAYKGQGSHIGSSQYSYGGFTINVYGAPGQDVSTLADIIEDRINGRIRRQEAAFA